MNAEIKAHREAIRANMAEFARGVMREGRQAAVYIGLGLATLIVAVGLGLAELMVAFGLPLLELAEGLYAAS